MRRIFNMLGSLALADAETDQRTPTRRTTPREPRGEHARGRPVTGRPDVERTPDGYRLVASRTLDAPADVVWRVLVEPARWPTWGPSITAVDCADDRIRAGTTGRVRTVGGLWLPFEITTCDDYRWTWRIGPVPATGHRVTPLGPDRCRVAFEVPLLAAPYVLVTVLAIRRIARLVE